MPTSPLVLLATCAELPDLDDDTRVLQRALEERGVAARAAVWTDPDVPWSDATLVLVRSTWDYARQRDRYLAWAGGVERVTRLHNPEPLLRWTTDKTYLRDLADAGVPVVATHFVEPGADISSAELHPFLDVEHVVKPAVSAGSLDTARIAAGDAERSRDRVRAVLETGRAAMVQPYVHEVDDAGETALVFVDGRFSHALRKGALLPPGHGEAHGLFLAESMSTRDPSAAELAAAERAMAAVPGDEPPLYARVDLLPGDDGPLLLELELAEPSFFLNLVPAAAGPMADAILTRL